VGRRVTGCMPVRCTPLPARCTRARRARPFRRKLAPVPLLWIALFWFFVAVLSAVQTWLAMITHGHSLPRMILYCVAVWGVWVVLTPAVFRIASRVPLAPPRRRNLLLHILAALVLSVVHVTCWTFLTVVIRPYDAMTITGIGPHLPEMILARLPIDIIIYFATVGVAHAIALWRRTADLERSLSDARLHALELQIQPHFLFNTLNAISALVRTRQHDAAVGVIAGLSDLLRYTLDHQGEQRVPLEQETAMLRRYLEIQRVRFADRLVVSIDVDDEARRAAVPTLILQPLAENAIRHGIARSAAAGRIEMRARRDDDVLRIDLFNTGSLAAGERRGIGLQNTVDRLRQLYAEAHRFELRQTEEGVLATLRIPWSVMA
jgi:two-component system LytT family sensor kinase